MFAVSVPTNSVRNSCLFKLVKEGVLKPGQVGKAVLPSGNEVTLNYVKDNGVLKAWEMSEIYRIPIEPVPEEYIEKIIPKADGRLIKSRHDIVGDTTILKYVTEHHPNGKINQLYIKRGA